MFEVCGLQIFGASTDVGKTISASLLIRSADGLKENPLYLKPIGSGGADQSHVTQYNKGTHATCLYSFKTPVSPHLAAKLESDTFCPSDDQLVDSISKWIRQQSATHKSLFIETAGGVHSPVLSGTSQLVAYRSFRFPVILVASPLLGGISSTISAYESLCLHGYDIDAVLCMQEDGYKNWEYLQDYFHRKLPQSIFAKFRSPPGQLSDSEQDHTSMQAYYDQEAPSLEPIIKHLQKAHAERIEKLESAPHRAMSDLWWPFTQQAHFKQPADVTVIDSAYSDHFHTFKHESQGELLQHTFDGSASWWTQALGHANQELALEAGKALARYGHVIFPGATHEPALELSRKLLDGVGKGWASRVFFTDNGSAGMEVAIKMALRAFAKRYNVPNRKRSAIKIIGLKGSYHGDTIGAMDATVESAYSNSVEWYRGRGFWFDPPCVRFKDGKPTVHLEGPQWAASEVQKVNFDDIGKVYDVESRLQSPLAQKYTKQILNCLKKAMQEDKNATFGALILEPLLLGAGGMIFVDPLFQRVLVDTIRSANYAGLTTQTATSDANTWQNMPVVFDEIFTGLHRLGPLTPSTLLGVKPDIACYAKILTGGMMPMAVTLASRGIYDCFLSENKIEALLHGHSYTAYPAGCAVASKALDMISKLDFSQTQADWYPHAWSCWNRSVIDRLSHSPTVKSAISLGSVLAVELESGHTGYTSSQAASAILRLRERLCQTMNGIGLHARPLGNVLYLMASLNTPRSTLSKLENVLLAELAQE